LSTFDHWMGQKVKHDDNKRKNEKVWLVSERIKWMRIAKSSLAICGRGSLEISEVNLTSPRLWTVIRAWWSTRGKREEKKKRKREKNNNKTLSKIAYLTPARSHGTFNVHVSDFRLKLIESIQLTKYKYEKMYYSIGKIETCRIELTIAIGLGLLDNFSIYVTINFFF